MNKFKSKKGFTLAELLIVVAIIAVLIAIAVPLFVGALDKAEEAKFLANQRSIKGMGVAILLTSDVDLTGTTYYATAEVDDNGNIGKVSVSTSGDASEWETWKTSKGAITAEITPTTLEEFTGA